MFLLGHQMKIRITVLLILQMFLIVPATLVRNNTLIYSLSKHTPFVKITKDSIKVSQSKDEIRNEIWIETDGFINKKDYIDGKLTCEKQNSKYTNKCKIMIKNTICLYQDSLLKVIIGKAWPIADTATIDIDEVIGNEKYLKFFVYGHADSNAIIEFNPWNNILLKLLEQKNVFKKEYLGLKLLIEQNGSDFDEEIINGLTIFSIYNENRPNPGVEIIFVIKQNKLKAIWCNQNLTIASKIDVNSGTMYYDDAEIKNAIKIKQAIMQILNRKE